MRRLCLLWLCVVAGGLCAASPAFAVSAWWHVTAEPSPTYLNPGVERSEGQEFKVNASGGDVLWFESETSFNFVMFSYNGLAGEVQSTLEGLYGAGNVEVSGGPVSAGQGVVKELEPDFVEFKGALAGRPGPVAPEAFFRLAELG